MSNYTLPQSVTILEFLAQHFDTISTIMRPQSDAFLQFCKALNETGPFDKNTFLLESRESIQFLQTLYLTNLTIYNKKLDHQFLSVAHHNSQITIVWESNVTTTINLGKFDTKFRYFLQEYNKNINPLIDSKSSLKEASIWLEKTLDAHSNQVQDSIQFIDKLLQSSSNKKIAPPKDDEGLFLLISCLPSNDLDNFYRTLTQLIQDDLHIDTPSGSELNIREFMSISANNFDFNFEKFKIHFNIGFSSSDPEIRKTIQKGTRKIITPLLEKPATATAIRHELQTMKDTHLLVCHRFYVTFLSHLRMMRHDKTYLS